MEDAGVVLGAREDANKRIVYESWVYKRGGGNFSSAYKKRYFVITVDHRLNYYKDPEDYYKNREKGWMSCLGMLIKERQGTETIEKKESFTFTILAKEGSRTNDMQCACETNEEREKLLATIENIKTLVAEKMTIAPQIVEKTVERIVEKYVEVEVPVEKIVEVDKMKAPKVKKLTYFALKAAIFPAVCCMEVGGADYEGEVITLGSFTNDLCKTDWPSTKSSAPNGQLPLCTLEDGSVIPESGAIMRLCAAQTGMLGSGQEFIISEMLIGMTGDLVKITFGSNKVPSAFTVDNFKSEAAVKEFNDETKPKAIEQVAKYAKWLLPAGDRFTVSGTTIGEIDFWCKLYMLRGSLPELAEGEMKSFFARMSELPGIKKVLEGNSKLGPLADYLVSMPQIEVKKEDEGSWLGSITGSLGKMLYKRS